MEFHGANIDSKTPTAYAQAIRQVERQILQKAEATVDQQNKHYYEMRAIELFDKKDDEISQAMARMLIKELDMRVEDMQPSATPAQNKVQPAS